MNERQHYALRSKETDIDGAIYRMCGSEELYSTCLCEFLKDRTIDQMNAAIKNASWNEAFTAAHALKGLAGNMGFIPLMYNTGQLIVLIRRGQINGITVSLEQINSSYNDVVDAIHQYFAYADKESKGEIK